MSNIIFQHTKYLKTINKEKDEQEEHDENLIDGDKGLSFKVFHRDGNSTEKYAGRRNPDGSFTLIHIRDNQRSEHVYTLQELINEIKNIKSLQFVVKYLSTLENTKQTGGRRISRGIGSRRKSRNRVSRKGRGMSRSMSRTRGSRRQR